MTHNQVTVLDTHAAAGDRSRPKNFTILDTHLASAHIQVRLSSAKQATVSVGDFYQGRSLQLDLTQKDVESACASLLDRVTGPVRQVRSWALFSP